MYAKRKYGPIPASATVFAVRFSGSDLPNANCVKFSGELRQIEYNSSGTVS